MKITEDLIRAEFKNVLFATDFSDAAALAIPYVREIAKRYHANVLTLHVRPARAHSISERSWTSDTQTAETEERHRKQILVAFPDARTSVLIRESNVEDHLDSIIHSRDVDLVVIGTTGQTRDGKHRLGSVAEEIFRRVTRPVLTVGPHSLSSSNTGFRKILCASDQASDHAVAHAVSLAQEFQSRLVTSSSTLTILTMEPAGQGRAARNRAAASEQALPSVGRKSFIGCEEGARSLAGKRTISTEQFAVRRIPCATLPSKKRPMAPLPCDPSTIRSAFQFAA